MVLPLFHLALAAEAPIPQPGSAVELTGAEAKHAATVRRMRVGEGIQLSNGHGLRVVGVVEQVEPARLLVRVETSEVEAAPEPRLGLVQALAKGDRDELAIQAATELGASAVIPWQADRSVSRWEGAKIAKGVERWQTIVSEAAKQALRAHTPQVAQPVSTKQLAKLATPETKLLVLDPTAKQALSQISLPISGQVLICVGPEGGIAEAELNLLEAAGATRVRLGSEILRTSTAGVAAISVLQSKLGRW